MCRTLLPQESSQHGQTLNIKKLTRPTSLHPPDVPYGARATWHQFSAEKDRPRRDKFLDLLGHEHAIVLGGHIHRFNALARATPRGRFAQFAVSSVIDATEPKPKTPLSGLADYTGD